MRFLVLIKLFVLISLSNGANAHSGNTNQDGCHINHYKQEYHCHQKRGYGYVQTYCLHVDFQKYCGYTRSSCNSLQRQYGGYCMLDY